MVYIYNMNILISLNYCYYISATTAAASATTRDVVANFCRVYCTQLRVGEETKRKKW